MSNNKQVLGVGIIGCGNICETYMKLAPLFKNIKILACSDIVAEAAAERADEFGVKAQSIDELLGNEDIDIVVNLTIPKAHYEVSSKILEAGKHVYSEKPFVLSLEEGEKLAKIAGSKNLRIGSSPDTFLGGSHQLARKLIDGGNIGKVMSGTCTVMSAGMESWHPAPEFFFKPGAGPVLDIGPYYLCNLVQLIGPVKKVAAMSSTPKAERTLTSEARFGEKIQVETPTTIHSLLEFHGGAIVSFQASWDVQAHNHSSMELYGETGTLMIPDPNFFGGDLQIIRSEGKEESPSWEHPFSVPNEDLENKEADEEVMANYRAAGLSEMAAAISENRPHRCSYELAIHVVEAMTAILEAGKSGQSLTLKTSCERPLPLTPAEAGSLLRE